MKKVMFLCISIVVAGCIDSEMDYSRNNIIVTVDKPFETIPYQLSPTATNKLTISFLYKQEPALKSLTLLKGIEKLLIVDFTRPYDGEIFTTDINFAFQDRESYDFLLETVAANDTIYTYHLNNYRHTFVQTFEYEKVDTWKQMLEYDVEPQRKYLFVKDYVNNESILKRISLENFTVQTLVNNFGSAPIRALSGDEIITYSRFNNGRFLSADSAALIKYNLNSGASQFIGWISADYLRLSRIVNNHIIFNNPVFTSKTSTLINLTDQSKKFFLNEELNPLQFRSNNFDNLYNGDNVFDWRTEAFVEKINLSENSFISHVDNLSNYIFVIETNYGPDNKYFYSRLMVYEGNNLIHQGTFEENCSYELGRTIDVSSNQIILFKNYGFYTKPGISGYYLIDVSTGESKLLQC
ncbi:MAG: hypothetical protein O9262_15400, partial [Cyclobacteriaceae bacterium]|nr:hypothetical protein [Cyclobacteriaceae bacterium]